VASKVITAVSGHIAKYPGATILYTGHSLGAALVTLAALDISRQLTPSNNIEFYTFGSPRLGNSVFSDYAFSIFPDGKYSRVTHYNDMVPHVPVEL